MLRGFNVTLVLSPGRFCGICPGGAKRRGGAGRDRPGWSSAWRYSKAGELYSYFGDCCRGGVRHHARRRTVAVLFLLAPVFSAVAWARLPNIVDSQWRRYDTVLS
jgi:hypothetical protein